MIRPARRTPFIGQQHEFDALLERLDAAGCGERALALVDERKGRDDATLIVVELGGRVGMDEEEVAADHPGLFPRVFRLFRRRG
jgi:hypothetical protein